MQQLYLRRIVLGLFLCLFSCSETPEVQTSTIIEKQVPRAWNLFLEKKYQSASNACNLILKEYYQGTTTDDLIKTNYIKSASELYLGNYFQASFYFQISNRLIELNGTEYPEIDRLYQLEGELLLQSGETEQALTKFRKTSETISERLKVAENEVDSLHLLQRKALCLTFMGDVFVKKNELQKALKYHQDADAVLKVVEANRQYKIKKALGQEVDWLRSLLYINFSKYYQTVDNTSKAIENLKKGKALAAAKNFTVLELQAGNRLGTLYQETGRLEAARNIFEENLAEKVEADLAINERNETQINLMELMLEQGKLDTLGLLLSDYVESDPIVDVRTEVKSAEAIEQLLAREIKARIIISRSNQVLRIGISTAILIGLLFVILYFYIRTKNRQLRVAQAELSESKLDLQQKNTALEQSNHDLVLSKREMNHRVKNTLQLIGSIIMSYQREEEVRQNPVSNRVLMETRNKIETILLLHNQLSGRRNNGGEIDLQFYLENLSNYLKKTLLYTDNNFFSDIAVQEMPMLHVEKAQNIGLAITELAINSYKYSPKEGKWLKIAATTPNKETLHLVVEDNGKELAKESTSTSLGLNIIREIIKRQFKGEFIDPNGRTGENTRFEVKIPIENLKK